MSTVSPSRARLFTGACLAACVLSLLVAAHRQRTVAPSSVVAKLSRQTPEESRLYWLASGNALHSCAELTYFIRRIGLDARTRGMASVLITGSDSVEDIVEHGRLPVELKVIPRIGLPRDSLAMVLVQPGTITRAYALSVVDAGLRPDSMLGEMRTWLMKVSLRSPVESVGHRE